MTNHITVSELIRMLKRFPNAAKVNVNNCNIHTFTITSISKSKAVESIDDGNTTECIDIVTLNISKV